MTGKKKWIAIAGLFVVTFVLMFFYVRQMRENRMQKDIAKEILRLHVVANSDSKKDQALKMEVKEAIVTYLRGVMQDAESVDEARIQIQKRLPEIEAVAKEKMQQKGYSYDADATLSSCYFPVKTYGDMIFPAGEYEALKVNLGKSAGKNWWCVMYPTLCFVDSTYQIVPGESKEKLKKCLTEEEYNSLLDGKNGIETSSLFIEWIRNILFS